MASYSTNLATITLCDSVTGWSEMASPHSSGSAPASTTENYIHNGNAVDQATGQATDQEAAIEYIGSSLTWTAASNWVVLGWIIYASPTNLKSWASGGVRIGIGSSQDNHHFYNAMGNDFGNYPYGGWQNTAIDPEFSTPDQTVGSPTTTIAGVAVMPNITAKITKGSPVATDAWRYGRADIVVTGTGATFVGMAAANDASTARWGLFQYVGGPYLWKGLMSLGTSGTSVTFSDSDKFIRIDDTPRVLSGFNKIEISNASSSVTLSGITIAGISTSITGSAPVSPGDFEMVDNATVDLTGCTFTDMGTFLFLSNGDADGCSWKRCGQITHGGGVIVNSFFEGYEGTVDTAYLKYNIAADPDGEMDGCSFTKGTASTHAIEFGSSVPTTMTLRGIDFSGYNASNSQTDSTLYFSSTGSENYIINLVGCTGNISYKTHASFTGTVTLILNPVALEITAKDVDGNILVGARVLAEVADGTNFPYQDSVSISRTTTTATVTHTAHGLSTGDWVIIRNCNTVYHFNGSKNITVTGVNTYTFVCENTGGTSDAGGDATLAIISKLTNASGIASESRTYSANQPIVGKVASASGATPYVTGSFSGTIDKDTGLKIIVQLNED